MLAYIVKAKGLIDIETQRAQAEMIAAAMFSRISREIYERTPSRQDTLYEEMMDLRPPELGTELNPISHLLYVPSFKSIKSERSLHVLHLRFRKVIPGDEAMPLLGKPNAAEELWRLARHTYIRASDTHRRMVSRSNQLAAATAQAEAAEIVASAFAVAKDNLLSTQKEVALHLSGTARWGYDRRDGKTVQVTPEQVRLRLVRALQRTGKRDEFKRLLKSHD